MNSIEAGDYEIQDNVIGGNRRSGIFALRGVVYVSGNRIGINRDLSGPLSNGASGVYIAGGPSSGAPFGRLGADFSDVSHNFIGFNEHFGIGIASDANGVSIRGNSIQANWQQGIDIGLDGVTPERKGLRIPVITTALWDSGSGTTIIEGMIPEHEGEPTLEEWFIGIYANDAPDRSGFGEGQYFLGEANLESGRFSFAYDGDLRGKWITATQTSSLFVGFAKPWIDPNAFDVRSRVTTTSEFSRAIEVSP